MNALYIGTSGWNYKEWKGSLYEGVPQKRWLEHYASQFQSVEINATFYRLLKEDTVRSWTERTPEGFAFAAKGSRYTTHTKRLKEPEQSVARQKQNLKPLQGKLLAICWQLPASLSKDIPRLQAFAQAIRTWPEAGHALEFRDTSWFDAETAECLARHNLAACISDAADWPRWDRVTADLVYIRLHGNRATYQSAYTHDELKSWAESIQAWLTEGREVHVYFDNTDSGAAVENAFELRSLLQA
ncbi:MAG: DUF72 domain-containing protein [Desulfovermiculus sp.]